MFLKKQGQKKKNDLHHYVWHRFKLYLINMIQI